MSLICPDCQPVSFFGQADVIMLQLNLALFCALLACGILLHFLPNQLPTGSQFISKPKRLQNAIYIFFVLALHWCPTVSTCNWHPGIDNDGTAWHTIPSKVLPPILLPSPYRMTICWNLSWVVYYAPHTYITPSQPFKVSSKTE